MRDFTLCGRAVLLTLSLVIAAACWSGCGGGSNPGNGDGAATGGSNTGENNTGSSNTGGDNSGGNNTDVGGSYESVSIGGKQWMKKNLDIETDGSWCYANKPDSCAKYGRLYTWEAAKSACESVGWRLPNTSEWQELRDIAGGANTAGKVLRSTNGWDNKYGGLVGYNGTDDFGFSALPGGKAVPAVSASGIIGKEMSFAEAGVGGYWWLVDESNPSEAFIWIISYYNDVMMWSVFDKRAGFSVRCVK